MARNSTPLPTMLLESLGSTGSLALAGVTTTLLLAITTIVYYDRKHLSRTPGEPPVYPSRLPLVRDTLDYGEHVGNFFAKARYLPPYHHVINIP